MRGGTTSDAEVTVFTAPAGTPLDSGDWVEAPLIDGGFLAEAEPWHHEEGNPLRAPSSATFATTITGDAVAELASVIRREEIEHVARRRNISLLDAERALEAHERRRRMRDQTFIPNRAARRKQEREARRARRG